MTQEHIAVYPVGVLFTYQDKHIIVEAQTRGAFNMLMTKFANRLPGPERGTLLMMLAELPSHLHHTHSFAGEGWRVTTQGKLGVTVKESLYADPDIICEA